MSWIGMIIGAAMGTALGLVFRCQGNTCPITSHWWIFSVFGAVAGLTWKIERPVKKAEEPTSGNQDKTG